jgi:hypothetical protein
MTQYQQFSLQLHLKEVMHNQVEANDPTGAEAVGATRTRTAQRRRQT